MMMNKHGYEWKITEVRCVCLSDHQIYANILWNNDTFQ